MLITLVASSLALATVLSGFWNPIFWAIVFGLLLQGICHRVETMLPRRPSLAAGLTVLAFALLVLVPAYVLATQILSGALDVYSRLKGIDIDAV